MSQESEGEIDLILTELRAELSAEAPEHLRDSITMGQSVTGEAQTSYIEDEIEWLGEQLSVPESARYLAGSLNNQYRQKKGSFEGLALELIAAACLYCSAKVSEIPLSPTDFAEVDEAIVSRKGLLRRSKDIASRVGLDASAFIGSDHYVKRYCEELELPDHVRVRAEHIATATQEAGLSSGRSPTGWAASAVYNACLDTGERITQQEISEIADVSEVTIRNRYKEQREFCHGRDVLPSKPEEVVSYVAEGMSAPAMARELAIELVNFARNESHPVDRDGTLWGLAALRRAGELTEETLGIKSLAQYSDGSSQGIRKRSKILRDVMPKEELARFRYEHEQ